MNFNTRDLILALLCAFLGSVKGLLVSKVKSLGPIEIFGLRSLGATCFIIPIIIFWNYKLWYDYKSNLILLVRAIVGNIAVCSYYFGFAYLPIAEASILFYSTPVFTIFIGCMFLKEKCGPSEMVSVIFSLLGIVLVSFPDFRFDTAEGTTDTFKGVIGSIIGAIAQAVALVVVRKITFIPPAAVSFWWALAGIPFSAALNSLYTGKLHSWQCGFEAWIIVMIAVIGFISELCLVAALKSTDAVIVSIALTSEILWAFILQIYVNNEWPKFWCILGDAFSAIMMIGAFVFPEGIVGMMDPSTTRRFLMPFTLKMKIHDGCLVIRITHFASSRRMVNVQGVIPGDAPEIIIRINVMILTSSYFNSEHLSSNFLKSSCICYDVYTLLHN